MKCVSFKREESSSKTTTILLGTGKAAETSTCAPPTTIEPPANSHSTMEKGDAYCPYCDNSNHYLNSCANFKQLHREQKEAWIRSNNRCSRCSLWTSSNEVHPEGPLQNLQQRTPACAA